MRRPRVATLFAGYALCMTLTAACGQALHAVRGPWVDDLNRPYVLASLRGSYAVVNMAYGACRRVCSASMRVLEQLQALADARQLALHVVVVGLDSSQDRPADWALYRSERKLARDNWHFLSGDKASTARMAGWLGVRFWHYDEHVMHDFRIVLVSPEGRVVAVMTSPDQDPARLLP